MAHYSPEMSRKLEAVLARLCEQIGGITKTRAVKLPYLVDVLACHALGRPIASGTYQTWEHGVVTKEVYAFITHGDGDSIFSIEEHQFSESGRQISLASSPRNILSNKELEVVDMVAEEFGWVDAARLGLLTKSLNPHLDQSDWGSNHEPELGEEAYARLADSWQSLFEKLPTLDLRDESLLEPIDDIQKHLQENLGA